MVQYKVMLSENKIPGTYRQKKTIIKKLNPLRFFKLLENVFWLRHGTCCLCSVHRLAYTGLIGGATAFRTKHFEQVNGFTNKFFGWGGEDDDMWQR